MSLVREENSTSLYVVSRLRKLTDDYWHIRQENRVDSLEEGQKKVAFFNKNHPEHEFKVMEVTITRRIL